MKINEAIEKRHSVREYEKKQVSKEILKRLILSASKAPSAKNEQPWRFYVVLKKEVRDKVIKILHEATKDIRKDFDRLEPSIKKIAEGFYDNLGGAPHIIFVYRANRENSPSSKFFNDLAGISCAIENMMLSAVAEGLGTCWVGTFRDKEKEISNVLNVPSNQELMATVLVGYPKKGYVPLVRSKLKMEEIYKFL